LVAARISKLLADAIFLTASEIQIIIFFPLKLIVTEIKRPSIYSYKNIVIFAAGKGLFFCLFKL
jgi:hypothetical protein